MKTETQSGDAETAILSASPDDADVSDQAQTRGKGDFGALWILVIVVAMAASTLWMIRDVWTVKPVASSPPHHEPASARHAVPAEPAALAASTEDMPNAAATGQSELEKLRQQKEQRLLAIKQEAKRVEQERLEAEQQLEAERAARAALEREHIAAEKRLEAERRARLALEEQRRKAEQKLARERAARAALEQEARLEQQRLIQARQQAEQAARERAHAEAQLKAAEDTLAAEPAVAAQDLPAVGVEEAPVTEAAGEQAGALQADTEVAADSGEASTFTSNPCTGPSARFLSTCR